MYYLLQAVDGADFMLFRRHNHEEHFYNNGGEWSLTLPHLSEYFNTTGTSPVSDLTWWDGTDPERIHATVLFKGKTLKSYYEWVDEHPEYLI